MRLDAAGPPEGFSKTSEFCREIQDQSWLEFSWSYPEWLQCRGITPDFMPVGNIRGHFGHKEEVSFMAFMDADAAWCATQACEQATQEKALDIQGDVEMIGFHKLFCSL